MELIYIWVEEYRCFKNKEFNFCPSYAFKFDFENNSIRLESRNENYVNIYNDHKSKGKREEQDFGEIVNITAIVGNNGAGKTTVLNLIRDVLSFNCSKKETCIIAGFKINDKVRFYTSSNLDKIKIEKNDFSADIFDIENESIKLTSLYREIHISKENPIDMNNSLNNIDFNSMCIIYHNNTLDEKNYGRDRSQNGNHYDLSLTGLINSHYDKLHNKEDFQNKDKITNYINKEILNQLKFITKYDGGVDSLPFNIPKQVEIEIKEDNVLIGKVEEVLKENKKEDSEKEYNLLNNFCFINSNKLKNTKIEEDKDKFFKELIRGLLNNLFSELFSKPFTPNNSEKNINILYECTPLTSENFIESCKKLIEEIDNKLVEEDDKSNKIFWEPCTEYYLDMISWLIENFKELTANSFINESENLVIKLNKEGHKKFLDFLKLYNDTCFFYNYLNFNWNLSSGESTFFSLYSRLYSILDENSKTIKRKLNDNDNNYDSVLLLLDEADLTLHPKWQQEYMKSLVNFIKEIYRKCKIQIIITTHSPIMLSDIPKSNIIFIRKDDKKNMITIEDNSIHSETFAANIYKLFNDSFFLGDKGAAGEFAVYKINKLYGDLKKALEDKRDKSSLNKNEIEYLIGIIGEPLIQHKLRNMKLEIFPEDKDSLIKSQSKKIMELQDIIKNGLYENNDELLKIKDKLSDTIKDIQKIIDDSGDKDD